MKQTASIPSFNDCAFPDDPQYITQCGGSKFVAISFGKIIAHGTVGECLTALHNVKGGSNGRTNNQAHSL